MKIDFNRIVIDNFLSYGHAELTLSNQGFATIVGINNNVIDNAQSNGSGKSGIWDALVWCLTGNTIRGTVKNLANNVLNKGCKVELDFMLDQHQYKVIRCKDYEKQGTNLFLYIDGENKSGKGIRDTEKLLQEAMPDITFELISSVIILGQGLPQRFSNNTPSGRKELLEKLSRSDFMIEDIKSKLIARTKQLQDEEQTAISDIRYYNGLCDTYDTQVQELREKIARLQSQDADTEYEKLSLRVADVQKLKDETLTQIDKSNITLTTLQQSLEQVNIEYNTYKDSLVQIQQEKTQLDFQHSLQNEKIKQVEKELNKLKSIKDVCPTCGQPLKNVVKPDTTLLESELSSLIDERDNIDKLIVSKTAELNTQVNNGISKYQNVIDEINNEIKAEKSLQAQYNTDLSQINQNLNDYSIELARLEALRITKETTIQDYTTQITNIENKISTLKSEITTLQDTLQKLQQHRSAVTKLTTIATREFRGYLLYNIISYIDKVSKYYCKSLFGTDNIRFELDGNAVNISYCNKLIENLSGGEQQKVNIIIQLAIREMLVTHLNFTSNILVLDEIFDGIDSAGCENLVSLLSRCLNDLSSIFIITHHSDISLPKDTEILVYKNKDGISEICQ